MSSNKVLLRVISSAVSYANRAGSEIRRIYHTGKLGVISKGFKDFQTEADRLSQSIIISNLSHRFPKCTILGEEDGHVEYNSSFIQDLESESIYHHSCPEEFQDLKQEDLTIWVDPLDGTSEFVAGKPESVTILIGVSVKQRAIAGVIHKVFDGYTQDKSVLELNGRSIWGIKGLGCFGIDVSFLKSDNLVVTTTASHGSIMINATLEAMKPDEIVRVGGAGYKVLCLLEGRANSYVFPSNGCKKWDTCAAEAVLEAAGGIVTDVFGKPLEYHIKKDSNYKNSLGVIASSDRKIHEEVLGKIPLEVKQYLHDHISDK